MPAASGGTTHGQAKVVAARGQACCLNATAITMSTAAAQVAAQAQM